MSEREMREGWEADSDTRSVNARIGKYVSRRYTGQWTIGGRLGDRGYDSEVIAQDATCVLVRSVALEHLNATGGHPDTARADELQESLDAMTERAKKAEAEVERLSLLYRLMGQCLRCVSCGGPVEPRRWVHAHPTCLTCLPAPELRAIDMSKFMETEHAQNGDGGGQ